MPIYPGPNTIAINNSILGYGTLPTEIGPMSMEFAIWLKARYDLHVAKQQALQDTEFLELVGQSFQNTSNREWDYRCRLAGTRGYTTELCDDSGNLTPLGLTTAELVNQHWLENVEVMQKNPQVTDPDLWRKTEQVFLMGNITMRQAIMLKLLLTAVLDAERTNRLELDKDFLSAQEAERVTERENIKAAREVIKSGKEHGMGEVVNMFAERQVHNKPQQFQARVFGHEIGDKSYDGNEVTDKPIRVAFVPTAMFGQRARSDLKNLIKYGLVDMKAYFTGVRGRPKHLVRVSKPGTIVVADLSEQGII